MATYHNISIEEMTEFLSARGFVRVEVAGAKEAVFARRVDLRGAQLSLRVYTGIVAGESRDAGKDAIRVCLFSRDVHGVVRRRGGAQRVHRVKGWKANLEARLQIVTPTKLCPKCGAPMIARKAKRGANAGKFFLACTAYPDCSYAESLKKVAEKVG